MSRFKSSVFNFGTVPMSTGTINWKFEFAEICKDLHYVDTGCICTTMTDSDKRTFIEGTLQLGLAGVSQTPGVHEVTKKIDVYYQKYVDEFIPDSLGRRIRNPHKKYDTLTLRGFVEVS